MKKSLLIVPSLIVLSIFVIAMISMTSPNSLNSPQEGVQYHSSVCILVKNPDGSIKQDNGCSPNLVTNAGLNLIKDKLMGMSSAAVNYIALCNASAGCAAPAAGDTALTNEYAAGGLSRSQGTNTSIGTGNFSISYEFTATADNLLTNKSGLFNASSSGTLFASNTFTLATLQTNDRLNITWYVWVVDS